MRRLLLLITVLAFSSSAWSQSYRCELMNITQTNSSTLEFDVYLYATGTDTIYLQSFQAGIYFNYAAMANGGTITGSFVANSSWDPTTSAQLNGSQSAPNWVINPISQQIRFLAAIQTSKSAAAMLPFSGPGVKMGTFRMTNTVDFSTCVKPNFVWSFVTGSNITRTGIQGWVNAATSAVALTTQTTFSYTSQGPQHFVQSNPSINSNLPITGFTDLACNSYTWQGNVYTTSGIYYDTLITPGGCDSILQLTLTIDTPTSTQYFQMACDNYFWPLSGMNYTTSGIYFYTTTLPSGCTHTDILNLTVNNSTTNTTSNFACNSYFWPVNGITYTNSTVATFNTTNTFGCPHVETMYLTVGHSNLAYDTIYNCSPLVWNGSTLSTSGNYTYTTNNASGCDSVTYLYFVLVPTVTDTHVVHSCGPYTVASNTYTTSGTYAYTTLNSFGCVVNNILFLTVGQNTYNTTSISGCGSIYYNGDLYSTSGVYTTIMPNAAGCDSIITFGVTIYNNYTISQYITTCDTYTLLGTTYTSSGIYYDTTSTINGCDSIIKLNLTIKKSTSSYTNQTAVLTYTWPVNGLNYTTSGIYTYVSTNSNGCPQNDTLNLTIDFPSSVSTVNNGIDDLTIYPNPSSDWIYVRCTADQYHKTQLKIVDMSGRVVQKIEHDVVTGKNELPINISNLQAGIYSVELWMDEKLIGGRSRVTKQ